MGKGTLIVVFAATLSYASINNNGEKSQISRVQEEAVYQESVLARQVAHSAFNVLVAQLTQDYANYRSTIADRTYQYGSLSYSAEGDREGPVSLVAYGEYGDSSHRINASMIRIADAVLDAVTTDGPISSVAANGSSFTISGIDAASDGSAGPGPDGHAISTTLSSAATALNAGIDADQAVGVEGTGDIVSSTPDVDLDSLEASIRNHPDALILSGDQKIGNGESYGTTDDPVTLVVEGDLELKGNAFGIGALLVEGSLTVKGDSRWEGVVLASTSGGEHMFKGNSSIAGAFVMRSLTSDSESGGEEDAGLPGGHFDLDVFKSNGDVRYHEHQYDDKFDVTGIDVLGANCETGGGLCWDELVAASVAEDYRIVLENGAAASGSFTVQTTTLLEEGPLSNEFSVDTPAADLNTVALEFDSVCSIAGSTPGDVWNDAAARDGAPTIKVYDTAPEEVGNPAVLLYEVAVYRHTVEDECGEEVSVDPISFYINGDVSIQWSTDAVRRLEGDFPDLQSEPEIIQMVDIREDHTAAVVERM